MQCGVVLAVNDLLATDISDHVQSLNVCLLFESAARFLNHSYHLPTTYEMGLLQKIVKNDAMKEDPPEIYGWKVYFLAFSVRSLLPTGNGLRPTIPGVLRRHVVRRRLWYYRRRPHSPCIQDVSILSGHQ